MSTGARACPRCAGVTLRDLRTRHGVMGWCPECQGHWATREQTSLSPLILQAVERIWELGSEGRCSLDLHDVSPRDERCPQCPKEVHRCPSCAARMWPAQVQRQRVGVCVRCPGLWLEKNGLGALRRTRPQRAFAWGLGRGGSFWLGREDSPSLGMRALAVGVVVLLGIGFQLFGELVWSLLLALWRFIHAHLGF